MLITSAAAAVHSQDSRSVNAPLLLHQRETTTVGVCLCLDRSNRIRFHLRNLLLLVGLRFSGYRFLCSDMNREDKHDVGGCSGVWRILAEEPHVVCELCKQS